MNENLTGKQFDSMKCADCGHESHAIVLFPQCCGKKSSIVATMFIEDRLLEIKCKNCGRFVASIKVADE